MRDKATENSSMSAAGSGASLLAHLSSARNSLAMKGFVCMRRVELRAELEMTVNA
ncbi:hypothetical protein E2C01_099924 [Portunus trituberculatus]|uniref:Uncharacterized protein n=1 Tax=Portunus trituberculatus TaxID=210409 RepID=A0A5B7KC64_PORTR|nr:hypothetical protein [Portunus trituberculatus]